MPSCKQPGGQMRDERSCYRTDVFSAPDKLSFLQRVRVAGYFCRVFFVSTADPRINAARVAGRMLQGGHSVPIDKISTRYVRSMANLQQAFELANRVYVYDNSREGEDARLTARVQDGQLRKVYGELPKWVGDAIAPLPLHAAFVDLRVA